MKKADITYKDNSLQLSGELDFFNVMSVYQRSLELFEKHKPEFIDLSRLKDANSATVALMVEWVKLSDHCARQISFKGVSADILALTNAANLEKILVINKS